MRIIAPVETRKDVDGDPRTQPELLIVALPKMDCCDIAHECIAVYQMREAYNTIEEAQAAIDNSSLGFKRLGHALDVINPEEV